MKLNFHDYIIFNTLSLILSLSVVIFLYVIKKTRHKGFHLFDSYLLGVFVYTLGSFFLFLEGMSDGKIFLFLISVSVLIPSIFLWAINRKIMSYGLTSESLNGVGSKNKVFLLISLTFVLIVNLMFIYLVYVRIIQDHFSGVFALLDIRKTISSGEAGYFYPGIIKQIRDIFAPAFIVWVYLFYQGSYKKQIFFGLFTVIILSMVFGGQRMPILAMFLALFIAFVLMRQARGVKTSKIKLLMMSVPPFVLIFILNIMLGRASGDEGFFMSFLSLLTNIITRVFSTVPHENLHILTYLDKLNMPYFTLWLSDLSILLPGTQIAFSNELHSYLGGSKQGNAVLGTPLDIYVNSGFIGLLVIPFIVYAVLTTLNKLLLHKRNPFSLSIFLVVFCYIPFCYSFYLFLLNGGLVVITYGLYNLIIPRKSNG